MTDTAINTVVKLLVDVGRACAEYQNQTLTKLPCKRLQCDEIWSFCYAKQKNVPADKQGQFGYGDVWTWTAICADTKIVPSWLVGNRDAETANIFMEDLASRLANRVQLTTDGLKAYIDAVDGAFGISIDYAMLVKMYGESPEAKMQKRYSPAQFIASRKEAMTGNPDRQHISKLCGAAEPNHENVYATVYAPDQCLFKEGGEPSPRRIPDTSCSITSGESTKA